MNLWMACGYLRSGVLTGCGQAVDDSPSLSTYCLLKASSEPMGTVDCNRLGVSLRLRSRACCVALVVAAG